MKTHTHLMSRLALSVALMLGVAHSGNAAEHHPNPPAEIAQSHAPRGLAVTPVLRSQSTVAGQPIAYLKTETPEVVSVLQTYQPGGETGWHYHLTSSHIFVLDGTLTLDIADESGARSTKNFTTGQAYMESVRIWHNARNLGSAPLKLLVVTFGEKDTGNNIFKKAP